MMCDAQGAGSLAFDAMATFFHLILKPGVTVTMRPILTVEFHAKEGDVVFNEESVTLQGPDELFDFLAPGGGCEAIPDEVGEIRMVFLPTEHPNVQNPVADLPATLQLGMVIFYGSLADIASTVEQILDRAGRGELSSGFLNIIGIAS
jgi:hypothetical protein